jgi:hypothetical protein
MPEAAIPKTVTPRQRALLVSMLHAGGLDRAQLASSSRQRRRPCWCLRGTQTIAHGYSVRVMVASGLAMLMLADDKPARGRLTLMGHWFAETLDAQWQRGEFENVSR